MPEGDTVYRQCRILDEALAGAVVSSIDLRVPRASTADLTGWAVREVVPRGKHLLMRFDPPQSLRGQRVTVHHHLMMDGLWHVDGAPLRSNDTGGGPRPAHTARIVLTAEHEDGRSVRAVGYDVQQVRVVPTSAEDELVGHLGPDLLGPDWGAAHRERAVTNLLRQTERPIGLALLDQRNLAGIGNIYRSELCFLQRLHPVCAVGEVAGLGALVDLAHRLLVLNRDRQVRVTTGGMLGRDGDLWVYGRGGRQCRRCRSPIVRGELGEPELEGTEPRVIFTCPRCQPSSARGVARSR